MGLFYNSDSVDVEVTGHLAESGILIARARRLYHKALRCGNVLIYG